MPPPKRPTNGGAAHARRGPGPQQRSGGGRGRGGGDAARKAPGKGGKKGGGPSPLQLKKAKTKFHQEKFKRQRKDGVSHDQQQQSRGSAGKATDGSRSHRTADVDIHLAAKISQELRQGITQFKARSHSGPVVDADLGKVFDLVPPAFVQQHLPRSVASFKTYLSQFQRGAPNSVSAFLMWYEWASFEANKGKSFGAKKGDGKAGAGADDDDEAPAKADEEEEAGKPKSKTRQVMGQVLKEREHMRALLQMCLRHNASKRKEGQHALVNHLNAKLADADCESLEKLRATAHHSVTYALSRLILGMATEDMAMIVLHCHALYLVLTATPISAAVVLSLIDEELAMSARMTAAKLRLDTKRGDGAGDDDADVNDLVDPDDISDPTKGERNQRLTAAVFALAAVVAAKKDRRLPTADARRIATFLCFCYVQQKATRILSANTLLMMLNPYPQLLADEEAMTWATFAFFYYPKMEYFRPEAVQFLVHLMNLEDKTDLATNCLPATVSHYMNLDPLQPSTLEQLANALFRKEQVTMCHPMVHPIWGGFFNLILQRCAVGESLKEHLTTFVHSVIAPYRRGNADVPRRTLFQNLVTRLGQIAVQSEDSEERVELLHMASKNAGYGARTSAKPTPLVELSRMPLGAIADKVEDLLRQYRRTQDSDPAARTNRTWVLRELRNCLYVPVPSMVATSPYVNSAVMGMLEQGFYPTVRSTDELSKNRCIYLFADVFSFTYNAAKARPKATVSGLDIVSAYLTAEGEGKTRFTTAVSNKKFLKARNRIVEVLEKVDQRSVLFYDFRDMEILLTLLFLILSVDDPTNSDAVALAASSVPDLVQFCTTGTLETLDLFLDVLMTLVMRASSPLQVMPLMTCVRRLAMGFILKMAPHIQNKYTLDIVLSPLREAYHTDSREIARLKKAKEGDEDDSDAEDDADGEEPALTDSESASNSDGDSASAASSSSGDDEGDSGDDDNEDGDGDDSDTATEATESDGDDAEDAATESDDDGDDGEGSDGDDDDAAVPEGEDDDEDALSLEEEEAPTQQFVDALKGMVGNADLDHSYPIDTANKDKSDVVRAIQLAARVGVNLRSATVVHVFQVLLAVCRETVKDADDVVFNAALSALDTLFLSKHRYYGQFLPATDLFQLLGDIQSYSRKLDYKLFTKENVTARAASMARRRFQKLKNTAIRVLHFVTLLAYKNHGGEEVRITVGEFYKSMFCDRGWNMKVLLPGLKKDLYHYRHAFAWALLPAVCEKFADVAEIDGPQRVRVFTGACTMVESMMSRLSGLPQPLKASASECIRNFLQSVTLEQVYNMKHTLPHTYLHAIKMVIQYNSRVGLDTQWVAKEIVAKAVDDDAIQLSGASVRLLVSLERMLGLTPRAKETKPPVPVKVLFQQFEKVGAKEKGDFYRKNKRAREKVLKSLLAYRNKDLTDEERATRRRRREELKVEDRLQRQVIREASTKVLTKEEREEKRRRILMAKQERIAKNRERKRRLHEARQRSFTRWRKEKLASAAAAADEAANDDDDDDE